MQQVRIRWVLAHEPLRLFQRAAEGFAKAVNARSGNARIEVEIMTLSEYSRRYAGGAPVTKHDLLGLMDEGKIEMSQMYTSWLAEKYNPDMHVLDMPFLFRDHDHAQRVLEGRVGRGLLEGLTERSNVRGLSFTYSGGFRMIPAKVAIRSLEDFRGLSLRSNKNPFAMETFRAVGAIPVAREVEEINDEVLSGAIAGGESAWPRVYPLGQNLVSSAMNDTGHSLFLTSMIVRRDFWEALPENVRELMREAAVEAAREERAESIRDGERAKVMAQEEGIEVVEFPESERARFRAATKAVYEKFESFFSPGLIDEIKLQ
jgi:TRAP-type C4-dicarboxylate transport system substrate-binding protein